MAKMEAGERVKAKYICNGNEDDSAGTSSSIFMLLRCCQKGH